MRSNIKYLTHPSIMRRQQQMIAMKIDKAKDHDLWMFFLGFFCGEVTFMLFYWWIK